MLHYNAVISKLTLFTVICNIVGPLKQWGETAAISWYCLLVLLWQVF